MHLRRHLLSALCATAVVVGLAGLANDAWAQYGRVAGLVKDESNQPLKGATIIAENPDTAQTFTATTDDKGRFLMIGLRTGTWRFIAQAPGFALEGGSMPIRQGTPNPPITFTLKKTGAAAFGALGGITAKDLQSDLTDAEALFKQSRWDESVRAYRSIMEKAPTTLAFLNLQIAAAHRAKKDHASALAAYEAVLKAQPDNEKAHIGIAQTHVERGDRNAAEQALLAAAQRAGAGREVFYQLGEMKRTNNQTDDAANWYRKAAAADPAWGKPLYRLGLSAIQHGDKEGATKLMAQVIAVDPVSPEAALAKSSLESLK